MNISDQADILFYLLYDREIIHGRGFYQNPMVLFGQFLQFQQFKQIRCGGFFQDHVLSRLESLFCK